MKHFAWLTYTKLLKATLAYCVYEWCFLHHSFFNNARGYTTIAKNEALINEDIKGISVRLISSKGEQLGIVSAEEANAIAEKEGFDLVMISPNAQPPVCRIMDYGKFRYEQLKKLKEQRKNQKIVETKEIQLSMTIDTHDVEIKAKHAVKFLQNGDKVKVSLRMFGRQQAYAARGVEIVKNFANYTKDVATIEKEPKVEGRNIIMFLAPINKK